MQNIKYTYYRDDYKSAGGYFSPGQNTVGHFETVGSVGGTSLGCRAEIRTRACLTASQRTTNGDALHPTN
jgi:hypothetical protein